MERIVGLIKHIALALAILVSGWSQCSCSRSGEGYIDEPTPNRPEPDYKTAPVLNLSIRLPRMNGNGIMSGNTYENFIDIDNKDYRIYFFDSTDHFIAEFTPIYVNAVEGTDYSDYRFVGRTVKELAAHSSFKVMVLANWRVYPNSGISNTTTVDDVCNDMSAIFSAFSDFSGSGPLIPMFGIHEYKGIDLNTPDLVELAEPVSLLRAVAKIEVTLNTGNDGTKLSSVELVGYNSTGYCAPDGVYSQKDYDESKDWDYDYLHTLHLLNGQNDTGATDRRLPLHKVSRGTYFSGETWIAYVPEFKNVDSSGLPFNDRTRARIAISFTGQASGSQYIDFKYYSDPPYYITSMKKGDFFDLKRNYCYAFSLYKTKERLDVDVDVIPYSSVELRPDYGLERDPETGWAVISKYAPDIYYYDTENRRYYDADKNEMANRVVQRENGLYVVYEPDNFSKVRYTFDAATQLYYTDDRRETRLTSPAQLSFPLTSTGLQIIRTNDYGEAIYFWDLKNNRCIDDTGSIVPLPCFGYQLWPENRAYMVIDYTDVGNYRIVYNLAEKRYYKLENSGGMTEMKAFPPIED